MKNEKMLEVLSKLLLSYDEKLILENIELLKAELRQDANKKSGCGSIEKSMKAILKNSDKLNSYNSALKYATYKNNFCYVCDSHRIFAYSGKIELPELPEGITPLDYEKIMVKSPDHVKIELPELAELKAELAILKSQVTKKSKYIRYYYKHPSGITLNLQYLIDTMECGEKLDFYFKDAKNLLFFDNAAGTIKGCILPVNGTSNEPGYYAS